MSRKKTQDPKVIALMDRKAKIQRSWFRNYQRVRRAFNALEKDRKALDRINRRLAKLHEATNE